MHEASATAHLCLAVRGDLIRILHKLLKRKHAFDAILIETTGWGGLGAVCQPAGLATRRPAGLPAGQSSGCVLYGLLTKRLLTGRVLRPSCRLADPAPVAQTFFVDDELKASRGDRLV